MTEKYRLSHSELRSKCDPKLFTFKNTSKIDPLDEVIGQKRAVQAIEFGLNMKSPGYNIFVTGLEGTGKTTITNDLVNRHTINLPTPEDWCMVNNFSDEFCPKAIAIPSGNASLFRKQMARFIEDIKKILPKAFSHKSYLEKKTEIEKEYSDRQQKIFKELEQSAESKKLLINKTQSGFQTIPTLDGKPMTPEMFQQLPKEQQLEIEENIKAIQAETGTAFREVNKIGSEMQTEIKKFIDSVAFFSVKNRLDILKPKYKKSKDILNYLKDVQQDIVENADIFVNEKGHDQQKENLMFAAPKPSFQRYAVNVLVDHKSTSGAPVIFESNPTYNNVFGTIEKRAYMGTLTTDFTMIQGGSLLKANGGYLIMEIESVLMNQFVWEALKRALQKKLLFIEDSPSRLNYGTSSLRPEPIPLEVKVILIGNYNLFQMLQNNDSKFNKIFKVRADFDYEVKKNEDSVQKYAKFVSRVCKEEGLLPLNPKGVSAIVEFGEKQIADKNKLSLRFSQIQGILKEADYWARKKNAKLISDKFVNKAVTEHKFRYNLYEEKIHESYAENTILMDVKGKAVGQVNALAVYQLGDISFGRPSRITAETFMGKSSIINIERESKLSGKTHDKGVLILSGYLGRTFAQKYPLSVSISITFEQSYGGIDGDSASSTELYAILSSLSGLPINQGFAVTGSVNQKGEIQAIGGVNEKIEGFFDVCKTKGFTKEQGVLIPRSNVKNLMLKQSVIDAVKKGKFHIYQVSTIKEGIEILTGVPAGRPNKNGNYSKNSVFGRVQEKLKSYIERSYQLKKEFGGEENE